MAKGQTAAAVAPVVDEAVAAATEPQVTVRPIEPQGKVIGFASVTVGGITVDDFKVVNGKNGLFLGAPSKEAPGTRYGYRATARVDRAVQEKLVARAEAVRPAPIKEQMAKAAEAAGRENAARPAPEKGKEARDER